MYYSEDEMKFENAVKKRFSPNKLSLQEYLVDLLGGLFPGILFILAFIFSIVPPMFIIASYFNNSELTIFSFINSFFVSIQQTPSAIWLVLFLLFLLLSYIVGHIFYRRDPKTPDRKGFTRLRRAARKAMNKEMCKKETEQIKLKLIRYFAYLYFRFFVKKSIVFREKFQKKLNKRLKENYGCTSKDDCEFPYPYYSKYLRKRGLKHLEKLALWSNEGDFQRSKTFVNILKIRLKYYFPDKYGTITRNEAHVRLASSAWYVSRISIYIGLFGFLISLLLCYLRGNMGFDYELVEIASNNLSAIGLPLLICLSSGYLKYNIGKFIHYQRLREVFYVLETAFTAFRDAKNIEKISPPFKI